MTIDQIFLVIKASVVLCSVGYISFLYLSRENLKKKVEDLHSTIDLQEVTIGILEANLSKLKEFSKTSQSIKDSTQATSVVLNDKETTDEEKDKIMADITSDFVSGK